MELVSLKCPSCGASIHVEPDMNTCFCTHCGSQIHISDPNNKTITYIDKAKIKEAEVHERIRNKELDIEDKITNNKKISEYLKYIALVIAVICIFNVLTNHDSLVGLFLISVIALPVAGIVAIFYFLSK